jgi:hypothetical protein
MLHHFDAVPDPTFLIDVDPDPDLTFQLHADLGPDSQHWLCLLNTHAVFLGWELA